MTGIVDSSKSNFISIFSNYYPEKLLIIILSAFYLYFFQTVVPNGDALFYASNVESGNLILNPNHILMDPIGLYVSSFFWSLGFNLETMDVFKIISAVSAVASLYIFHTILILLGIKSWTLRLIGVVLIFSSRNFMSMAISEEFYIVQIPFLLLGLLFSIKWILNYQNTGESRDIYLYLAGFFLGLITAIALNNVFVLFFIGLFFGIADKHKSFSIPNTLKVWIGGGLLLIPLYLSAYFSSSSASFFDWMFSYQGKSENPTEVLYGLQLTVQGVFISLSKLAFNMPVNFIDVGGLGTILKGIFFSIGLEYQPNYLKIIVGSSILLCFIAALFALLYWALKNVRNTLLIKFSIFWIIAYLVFNFYWNDSSDQFWFQILPVIWLLFFNMLGLLNTDQNIIGLTLIKLKRPEIPLAGFALIFLLINSANVMYPLTFEDMDAKYSEHKSIIKNDDLEIFTGWDNMQWMVTDDSFPDHDRIMLMELALKTDKRGYTMEELPVIVKQHLASGNRVIVARLYQKDYEIRPWDNLRKAGWPRQKIIDLLNEFEHVKIYDIDGVGFYQLKLK